MKHHRRTYVYNLTRQSWVIDRSVGFDQTVYSSLSMQCYNNKITSTAALLLHYNHSTTAVQIQVIQNGSENDEYLMTVVNDCTTIPIACERCTTTVLPYDWSYNCTTTTVLLLYNYLTTVIPLPYDISTGNQWLLHPWALTATVWVSLSN